MTLPSAWLHLLFGVVLNALLFRATRRLLTCLPPEERVASGSAHQVSAVVERGAAALIIVVSLIVLTVTIGGAVGVLNRPAIVLTLTAALSIAVGLVGSGARNPAAAETRPADAHSTREGRSRWILLPAAILGLTWLPLFCERIVLPPVAWDALTYHLRHPVLWLQTGTLLTAAAPVGDPSHTFFPLVGDILLYWGVLSTGTDLLSSLSQIPFATISASAVAWLSIRCGAGLGTAVLGALCWLATPSVLRQSVEPMLDIELTTFSLCSLLFALRWSDSGGRHWFLLTAASIGLLIGTKYVGLVYLLAALPLLIWIGWSSRRRLGDWRIGAGTLVAGALLASALGAYAYARNVAAAGNPLLPMRLTLSANMSETRTPWEFSVEGEVGVEDVHG